MPGLVRAQQIERIVANKIHIDSLAILSNRNFGLKIYYQGNTNIDSLKLSISSTKTSFPADLENALRPEGFSVTLLGDNIFILKGGAGLSVENAGM